MDFTSLKNLKTIKTTSHAPGNFNEEEPRNNSRHPLQKANTELALLKVNCCKAIKTHKWYELGYSNSAGDHSC